MVLNKSKLIPSFMVSIGQNYEKENLLISLRLKIAGIHRTLILMRKKSHGILLKVRLKGERKIHNLLDILINLWRNIILHY